MQEINYMTNYTVEGISSFPFNFLLSVLQNSS